MSDLIHITTKSTGNPEFDIKPIINKLYKNISNIIYSIHFKLPSNNKLQDHSELPQNIRFTNCPEFDLDYDASIASARKIFLEIYPEAEFLPRAPDPEEIIIGEDNDVEVVENNANAAVELMRENTQNEDDPNIDDSVDAAIDAVEDLNIQ